MRAINAPANYAELLTGLPERIRWNDTTDPADLVHIFATEPADVEQKLFQLKSEIKMNGAIWVSWPKKTSRLASVLNENTIRDTALALGLVDVKVCAVDNTWSGLKLVWRKENRT